MAARPSSRQAMLWQFTRSTLVLIVLLGNTEAARHRAPSRHPSARHSSARKPDAFGLSSVPFSSPSHQGFVADSPHDPVEFQQEFCRTVQPEDQTARLVPISFHNLAFSIFLYKSHDYVSTWILKKGSWESRTSSMVLEVLEEACSALEIPKETAVFLDIGANIGWYSLLLAAAGHSVISFEPMQANEKLFRRSICSNFDFQQRLTYHTDTLSDVPHKNCTLYSDEANVGDGTVSCDQNLHLLQSSPEKQYYVRQTGMEMTTLDIVLADLQHPVFMVKIDVEGHEGHVLRGATQTILQAQVPYLMFEFKYAWIKKAEGHPDKLLKSLVEAGYTFSFKAFHGKTFDPLVYYADPAKLKQRSSDIPNIFCTHKRMLHLGIERESRSVFSFLFG